MQEPRFRNGLLPCPPKVVGPFRGSQTRVDGLLLKLEGSLKLICGPRQIGPALARLHAGVVGAAAAFGRGPADVGGGVLDLAGLAVQAVGGVDAERLCAAGGVEFVDTGGADALLRQVVARQVVARQVVGERQGGVVEPEMHRLVFGVGDAGGGIVPLAGRKLCCNDPLIPHRRKLPVAPRTAPQTPLPGGVDSVRLAAGVVAAFIVVQVAIIMLWDTSCLRPGTLCGVQTDRYGLDVGTAIWQYKAFLIAPDVPYTDHPPGHAIVLAATFAAFGADSYLPIIAVQMAMMIGAGLLLRIAVNAVLPGYGIYALAFVLLNPNLLANFNVVSTVAFEMFFLTAALAAGIAFFLRPGMLSAAACGAAVGLAMWSRPTAQVLLPALPFLFPLLKPSARAPVSWRQAIAAGGLATVVALVVISPWMLHQMRSGETFRTSSSGHEALLLQDSLRNLYPGIDRIGQEAAETQFRAQQMARLEAANPDWETLGEVARSKLQRDDLIAYYLSMPFGVAAFAREVALSWGRFFAAGGEGEFHRLLGIEDQPEQTPVLFHTVKFAALGFALALRLLGIAGVFEMIRRGHYGVLVLTAGLVTPYLLSTFLVGQPRYRVPVESALVVMAVYGLALLLAAVAARRRGRTIGDQAAGRAA